MSEFNNRIAAQRQILQLINKCTSFSEELFGLSQKAIERWVMENNIETDSILVTLVRNASEKLFFLANKSQEQITEEYKSIEAEIKSIYRAIDLNLNP